MIAAVAAVKPEELTLDEQCLREQLEHQVELAFYQAGIALQSLRDKRLYRSSHKTFEEYCRDRFGHSRQKSNYLIAAAGVFENLTTICCQNLSEDLTTDSLPILPSSEGQVRPLTKLEPDLQRSVWQTAVLEAGNKAPSGRIVKDVIQRITERTRVPNPYRIGEVCQFVVKDNPDLRGKGGCWCIVSQVNEFSCTVMAWDGEYTLNMEHIKSLLYSDSNCEEMHSLCLRIAKLRSSGKLEDVAMSVLKQLGEVKRPYLTTLEEKLMSVLEQEYGLLPTNLE